MGDQPKKYIGIETDVLAEYKNLNKGRKIFSSKKLTNDLQNLKLV